MVSTDEIKKIKETVEEFLQKMTFADFTVELQVSSIAFVKDQGREKNDEGVVDIDITIKEPQVLIGQNGQTLVELHRILRIMLNKKLSTNFYVMLDINDYKKKKAEYLKSLAKGLADEVSLTQEKRVLSPMPADERRVIHTELAGREDILTESQGEGFNRCVVISPRQKVTEPSG